MIVANNDIICREAVGWGTVCWSTVDRDAVGWDIVGWHDSSVLFMTTLIGFRNFEQD